MAIQDRKKLLWDDTTFTKTPASVQAITGVYGKHMVLQSGINDSAEEDSLVILDNACGTGIVTAELQQQFKARPQRKFEVTCGDLADAMIDSATARVRDQGWDNTRVVKIDAQDTGLPDNYFTHIFTNFGVMLVPEPDKALSECFRMLKPGGVCSFTTWQQVGWIEDIRTAMASIPGLPELPSSFADMVRGQGDWDDEDYIVKTMEKHDFSDIVVRVIPNTSIVQTPEEIPVVLRACVTIATKKFWTQEQQEQFENDALFDGVSRWMAEKYVGRPIEWHWVALVTTAIKKDVAR